MGEQSAARLEGDRYQHLFSWWVILALLDPQNDGMTAWVEHPHAGSADDVTVHPGTSSKQRARYYQVKWHVDYRSGYSMASLIERTNSATSLLEKLWRSWQQLGEGEDNELWLVSNWPPQAGDLLGELIKGRDYRLDEVFLSARPRTKLGRWRKRWQEHLQSDDEHFAAFYRSLRFRLGYASLMDLEESVDRRMRSYGIKSGEGARGIAIDQVRQWIERGGTDKRITADVLRSTLDRLDLWEADKKDQAITLIVHTWTVRTYDCQSDYELDWSAHFDHRVRRVPDSMMWNQELVPALRAIEQRVSRQTSQRLIRLRGSLCLSAAFAVGHVFSVAGGYRFEIPHRTQLWQSDTPPDPSCQLVRVEKPGSAVANDVLIVVNITGDASPEVQDYLLTRQKAFRASLYLSPAGGSHDYSVQGAAQASALARLIRLELRYALGLYKPETMHLFYFGPQSLAILIGQKLNACGSIQLYEFRNPGYVPSCLLS